MYSDNDDQTHRSKLRKGVGTAQDPSDQATRGESRLGGQRYAEPEARRREYGQDQRSHDGQRCRNSCSLGTEAVEVRVDRSTRLFCDQVVEEAETLPLVHRMNQGWTKKHRQTQTDPSNPDQQQYPEPGTLQFYRGASRVADSYEPLAESPV